MSMSSAKTTANSSSVAKSQAVATSSSNNEDDIQMASAIKERATETIEDSNSVAKDAEEQSQETAESRGDNLERVDSEDSEGEDSEGEDFNMSGDRTWKGKGKEKGVKGRSNNGGDDATSESSGADNDDDDEESNDETVPKPMLRFQRPRGGAGPRLRVDPTKPSNHTPKPPTHPTGIPTSTVPSLGVPSLGMTPEQVAAIVQIVLATQSQNKSVAPQRTKKKNVTGTIVEQAHRDKDPRTTVLVSAIRKHMNKLLHLKSANEAHKLPQPTKKIVDAFAGGEGTGPKLVPLELAFAYKKKEPWNARVAELFFDDFLEHQGRNLGVQKSEWPTIYEKFWQRFSNLKKEWKNWQAKEGEDDKEVESRNSLRKKKALKTTRRDARRHHLQDLRIQIAEGNKVKPNGSVDDVWHFLWVVASKLGLGGASSDKSSVESEGNRRKFFIKSVPWRSRELIPYLQTIDCDFNQYNRYGNSKPGNPYRERTRLAVGTPSTRSAIKGLPLNFYDKTWLSNLTNEEMSFLQPKPAIEFPVIIAYKE